MDRKFDLVVIGTGEAGAAAARECRGAGWTVAIVDSGFFGGTCALRGCDPSKALVAAAQLVDWNKRMEGLGVSSKDVHIDWPALIKFKRSLTEPVPAYVEKTFLDAGIATFHGRARFVDKNSVEVGNDVLNAKHVVIATGTKPVQLRIPGAEYLVTSDGFMELEDLPSRIIFVGGGYITFEFAHVVARAGAKVQILHREARFLELFEPDLVTQLTQATQDIGVDIRLNTLVTAIRKESDRFVVTAAMKAGDQTFEADMVAHGAGRVPDIDDLDLEKAGIKWEARGISVNEHLQSVSNPAVYAAGDAAATSLQVTPVADMEGSLVARNLLEGNKHKTDYNGIPTVVFSIPALASVGLQEEEARKQGLKFKVSKGDTSGWYSSRRVGMKYGAFKILIEDGTQRILGAHLLGPEVEEAINIFAAAIRLRLSVPDLKHVVYSYPSKTHDINWFI
jgi:glutathione reductase (NADPH)